MPEPLDVFTLAYIKTVGCSRIYKRLGKIRLRYTVFSMPEAKLIGEFNNLRKAEKFAERKKKEALDDKSNGASNSLIASVPGAGDGS